MPNHNCMEDAPCPHGGPEERFVTTVTINGLVTDAGRDPVGSYSWDDDSFTHGSDGRCQGTLKEFGA